MVHDADVLILGAGPAGLLAAYDLARAGLKPLILEARDRIGGRIHTLRGGDDGPLELGAEFIHGNLPITQQLLGEAGLAYTPVGGRWVQVQGGRVQDDDDDPAWDALVRKMGAQKDDIPLQQFLTEQFPDPGSAGVVARAVAYAEGYDTADASKASTQALHAEWSREEDEQYRPDAGYGALADYLAGAVRAAGGTLRTGSPVTRIEAKPDGVAATTADGQMVRARHAVLALPLGVLQHETAPEILPAAPAYRDALQTLGFGDVLKIVLRFRTPFWEAIHPGLGFLLSGAPIPTWWTTAPARRAVLTGWLGGRTARVQAGRPEAALLDEALESLAGLFSQSVGSLRDALAEAHVVAWSADPYTRGAYNYGTVGGAAAKAVLADPLEGTLHFAGEYMHPDGPVVGTVEAALWSGRAAAKHVLAVAKRGSAA